MLNRILVISFLFTWQLLLMGCRSQAPNATPEPSYFAEADLSESTAIYRIDQSKSHVRFELDEDYLGRRILVTGSTEQIFGEIALDLADLSTVQLSPIRINARGFITDNGFRNRAIQSRILLTGLYEFVTFVPTAVNNLPPTAAINGEIEFTIDGDLTILETTRPVTFNAKVTAVSPTKLKGWATAVIQRDDFDLIIPSATNVANVEQEVELIIVFTAKAP